jgi:CDP-4-dehydro-6-deoxyglucose reductase, E1
LKVTDMQAAVGLAQLAKLDEFGAARRRNWAFFREAFADLEDRLILPEPTRGSDPSWFGFMMTVRDGSPFSRDAIVRHLESKKIQTRMLFAGNLVRQPAMTRLVEDHRRRGAPAPYRVVGPLTRTDQVMNRSFWIGVYPGLTGEQRAFVAQEVRAAVS